MSSVKVKGLVKGDAVSERSWHSLFYIGVLFFSCLLFSRSVLDHTLIPRFLILSLGLLLVLSLFLFRKKSLFAELRLPDLAYIGYIFMNILSVLWAGSFDLAVFDAQKVFACGLVFFLTSFFLRTDSGFESKLIRVGVIITLIYAAGALLQYLKLPDYGFQTLYNVQSLSGHKNLLSCLLFLAIPLSFAGIFSDNPSWKPLYIGSVIVSILMILLLQTRSVWLALLVSLPVTGLFAMLQAKGKFAVFNWRILLISAGIVLVASFVYLSAVSGLQRKQLLDRFDLSTYSKSTTGVERLAVWEKTAALCREYPVTGVGAGNWQIHYPKNSVSGIQTVEFENQTFQRPHNDFLWVLAENGIAGFIFYCIFFLTILFAAFKTYLTTEDSRDNLSTLLLGSGIAGFLIISFFDFPRERIEILIVINVIAAVLHRRSSGAVPVILSYNAGKHFNSVLNLSLVIMLFFCLITGFARAKGEHNMNKVYQARAEGNSEKMLQYCDKASSLFYQTDPTTIPINWYRGQAYFSSGRYPEAQKEYEKAVSISPYNHYLLNDLASAYEQNGNHKKAEYYYLEALKINPSFDDPKLNLAAVYYNAKKYNDAWRWTNSVRVNSKRKEQYLNVIRQFIIKP
jgi:O-antigen ligase